MAGDLGTGRPSIYRLGRRRRVWRDRHGWAGQPGVARIEGPAENFRGINVNGGKAPEHPATFPRKGKTAELAFVDGVLYAAVNLQDGPWPDVHHALAWSTDRGATWTQASWLFPMGAGDFQPATFLQFGKGYTGLPSRLAGYVYLCGPKHVGGRGNGNRLYLARAARGKLRDRLAYEFFHGLEKGEPTWTPDSAAARPIFTDLNGALSGAMVYNPGLKRFLLTCFHAGPGELGVFDAAQPWGPWSTIAYYEHWGQMGAAGEGLNCEFPQKWMSDDGLALWCIFSVYGDGGKQGIWAHDRFNLVKATLRAGRFPPTPKLTVLGRLDP